MAGDLLRDGMGKLSSLSYVDYYVRLLTGEKVQICDIVTCRNPKVRQVVEFMVSAVGLISTVDGVTNNVLSTTAAKFAQRAFRRRKN